MQQAEPSRTRQVVVKRSMYTSFPYSLSVRTKVQDYLIILSQKLNKHKGRKEKKRKEKKKKKQKEADF